MIKCLLNGLFCKHDYQFLDQHLIDSGMRKMIRHKCIKCGKIMFSVLE